MYQPVMESLMKKFRPYFSDDSWEKGWEFYIEETVEYFKVVRETIFQAIVYGNQNYMTKISTVNFEDSSCTCPHPAYCPHMAAVLYKACAHWSVSPRQFLRLPGGMAPGNNERDAAAASRNRASAQNELRASRKQAAASSAAAVKSAAKFAAAASPRKGANSRIAPPKETDSAADWHRYFNKQFPGFRINGINELQTFHTEATSLLLPPAAAWPEPKKRLYEIHFYLFLMTKAEELYEKHHPVFKYHYGFAEYFDKLVDQCIDPLREAFNGLNTQAAQLTYNAYFRETIDFLSEHAFPANSTPIDWQFIYSLLWWNLLYNKEWIKAERERLDKVLQAKMQSPAIRDAHVMAAALFHIMDGDDDKAMELTSRELAHKHPHRFGIYLQVFVQMSQWDRLKRWLTWLLPMVQTGVQQWIEVYYYFWEQLEEHDDIRTELASITTALLPNSYQNRADLLFEQKRYDEWIDLTVKMGLSPDQILDHQLREVEKNDVFHLLPLYHHAVERHILEKHRESYRLAIQFLKKLKQLYKKLGQTHRWDLYISGLSKQYASYRAFQEELQKGKLIK